MASVRLEGSQWCPRTGKGVLLCHTSLFMVVGHDPGRRHGLDRRCTDSDVGSTRVRLEVERGGGEKGCPPGYSFLGSCRALSLSVTHREKQTPRNLSQLGSSHTMIVPL